MGNFKKKLCFIWICVHNHIIFVLSTGMRVKRVATHPHQHKTIKTTTMSTELKTTDLTPAEMHDYLKNNYTENVYIYISEFVNYVEIDKEDLLFNIENSYFSVKYQFFWSRFGNKIYIRFEKN